MCKVLKIKFLMLVSLILLLGCDKSESNERQSLNSFSMNLNDQSWKPSVINNDPCSVAYNCSWWEAGNKTIYTIKAYKGLKSNEYESENIFLLQISNVNHIGEYYISDAYDPFSSYARFIRNEQGNSVKYDNSTTKMNSIAFVLEMPPVKYSFTKGIRGSFSGVLYNTKNPNDSMVIDKCEFTFNKINWNNFCQCEE